MEFIALLSGENIKLSEAELKAVLEKQGIEFRVIGKYGRILRFFAENTPETQDFAFVQEISEYLGRYDDISSMCIDAESIAVRVRRVPKKLDVDVPAYEREAGRILSEKGIRIDLKNPGKIIRLYITDANVLVGSLIWKFNATPFNERRAHLRPFSSPVSLHPKLARGLVNLARIEKEASVLDPFCGTGGLLIEATLIGADVHGIDLESRMVEGCRQNLAFYGSKAHRIERGNALEAGKTVPKKFDAVITDLPYGRSTKVENAEETALQFMKILPSLLKKGKFAVVAYNKKNLEFPGALELTDKFGIYVHKSLTRYVFVFRKS